MSLDTPSTPCPNCGNSIRAGAPVCPNCGWDTRQGGIWPPGILHDSSPSVQRKNVLLLGLQLVGGTFVGAILTYIGTVFLLAGPIACIVIFIGTRKQNPYFGAGILTGMAIGLVGVAACFYSFRKF